MKKILLVLSAFAILLLCVGCQQDTSSSSSTPQQSSSAASAPSGSTANAEGATEEQLAELKEVLTGRIDMELEEKHGNTFKGSAYNTNVLVWDEPGEGDMCSVTLSGMELTGDDAEATVKGMLEETLELSKMLVDNFNSEYDLNVALIRVDASVWGEDDTISLYSLDPETGEVTVETE